MFRLFGPMLINRGFYMEKNISKVLINTFQRNKCFSIRNCVPKINFVQPKDSLKVLQIWLPREYLKNIKNQPIFNSPLE
jgi:hypothetical protein